MDMDMEYSGNKFWLSTKPWHLGFGLRQPNLLLGDGSLIPNQR